MNGCWLIRNGVPFDNVFPDLDALLPHEQLAMGVVFSELEGNEFDWSVMRYKERKPGGV
nr:hypothetical protein [Chromobacterium sp. ASV5]